MDYLSKVGPSQKFLSALCKKANPLSLKKGLFAKTPNHLTQQTSKADVQRVCEGLGVIHDYTNERSPESLLTQGFAVIMAASYSPALHCSTIGAGGLNFSVRNGKRWDPAAITTWKSMQGERNAKCVWALPSRSSISTPCQMGFDNLHTRTEAKTSVIDFSTSESTAHAKVFGQLVVLGFDVAVFTPAPYQRHRLWRPSMES